MNTTEKTKDFVLTAMFTAIIFVLAFVPYLGYIPLGVINATTIHIPVIIGAIYLGPKKGAFLGGMFGVTSLMNNTFKGGPTAFVFSPFYSAGMGDNAFLASLKSLTICFVPRILIGVAAYYVFLLLYKLTKGKKAPAYLAGGLAGSLTNTILVMNGIYFLFGESYAAATGKNYSTLYSAIMTIIGMNGVPEAIVACLITAAICPILRKLKPLYIERKA